MNPARSASDNTVALDHLLEGYARVSAAENRGVSGIQIDSRQLTDGNVFIALDGMTVHGLDFLDKAMAVDLAAVVVDANRDRPTSDERQRLADASVPLYEVQDLPAVTGELVSRFHGDPSRALEVVGVTGTDGKTSVCHLVGQALNARRPNCGLIGTLGVSLGSAEHRLFESALTTPDAVSLHTAFARFRDAGAAYAAMEVSSHALVQQRVAGVAFDVAVFTNLGRDHLDYHGDMKSYRQAKELLFQQPGLRAAVINTDDEVGAGLAERCSGLELTTYGASQRDGAHVRYLAVKPSIDGLRFTIQFDEKTFPVHCGLLGRFNVENLAATFAVLVALGLGPDLAADSLQQLQPVAGRMESVRLPNGVVVIIDYAHNPHALESLLNAVRDHANNGLSLVFGCGGDRDAGKRPLMAAAAEQYADYCIVTDDNPRGENGDHIVEQVIAGFTGSCRYEVNRDRRSAICQAINEAGDGDIVVVAGKGHEDYQLIGDQRLSFSDREVVEACARELVEVTAP